MRVTRDAHHVCFYRQEWRLRPEAKAIREHPSLVPNLDRDAHEELHANCSSVPPLGYHTLIRVAKNWYPQRDTLRSMDELMYAIDKASEHPLIRPIERDVAQLAIQAIDAQKPYIEEGLVIPNTQTIIDLAA